MNTQTQLDFQQFIATNSIKIGIMNFIINMLLSAVLAFVLRYIYNKWGSSISNRRQFSSNFIFLTMTTMLIISVVKSSLALSLGLVGALSIVRFRTAIKEPEELTFLFLSIGIGLGLGADQRVITVVAFLLINLIYIVYKYLSKKGNNGKGVNLIIISRAPDKVELERVITLLKRNCDNISLKRLDEDSDTMEASFLVELADFSNLNTIRVELERMSNTTTLRFLDVIGS